MIVIELLPPPELLTAYLLACLVLAITPGPGVFYVVTRSLVQGRRSGIASVTGLGLGTLVNAVVAAVGLAALFSVSALAFTMVKFIGAGYLIYLGICTIRERSGNAEITALAPASVRRIFIDGALIGLFNPKTVLFFAAFLPQFIHTAENVVARSIVLGVIFVLIAMTTDLIYVMGASGAHKWMASSNKLQRGGRWLAGSAFIGLGIFTAFLGGRQKA